MCAHSEEGDDDQPGKANVSSKSAECAGARDA